MEAWTSHTHTKTCTLRLLKNNVALSANWICRHNTVLLVPELIDRLSRNKDENHVGPNALPVAGLFPKLHERSSASPRKNSFRILGVVLERIPARFFQLKCNRASFKTQHITAHSSLYRLLKRNADPINCDPKITIFKIYGNWNWM